VRARARVCVCPVAVKEMGISLRELIEKHAGACVGGGYDIYGCDIQVACAMAGEKYCMQQTHAMPHYDLQVVSN